MWSDVWIDPWQMQKLHEEGVCAQDLGSSLNGIERSGNIAYVSALLQEAVCSAENHFHNNVKSGVLGDIRPMAVRYRVGLDIQMFLHVNNLTRLCVLL
jgi:hypothetical protein